jgi:hypothetical protein
LKLKVKTKGVLTPDRLKTGSAVAAGAFGYFWLDGRYLGKLWDRKQVLGLWIIAALNAWHLKRHIRMHMVSAVSDGKL